MGILRDLAERFEPRPRTQTIIPEFAVGKSSFPQVQESLGKAFLTESQEVSGDVGERHPFDFKSFKNAYLNVPLVHGAVDKKVDFIVGRGYYVESDNDEAKKFIENWLHKVNFNLFLRPFVRDGIVFGSSFSEVLWARTEEGNPTISSFRSLPSEFMYVRRNKENGELEGYTLYFPSAQASKNKVFFDASEVINLRLNVMGDSAYGTSDVNSLFGTSKISPLLQKLGLEEIVKKILARKAGAPIHVMMGSDEYQASPADVDAMAADLQSMHELTEWVTSHNIKMEVLSFEGKVMDLTKHLDRYDLQLLYGLQVPEVLMGKGSIPEGLATVQLETFERHCAGIQEQVERVIEEDIFEPLLQANGFDPAKDHVEFVWGSPTPNDENAEIDKYVKLMQLLDLSPSLKMEIEKKIATLMGIEDFEPEPKQKPRFQPQFGQSPDEPQQEFYEFFKGSVKPEKYSFYSVREADAARFSILPQLLSFLAGYSFDEVSDFSDGDKEKLRDILLQGIRQGASPSQIAGVIADSMGMDSARAEAIARTEIARAENQAAVASYRDTGLVEEVEFLTAEDDLVDEECASLNGRKFAIGTEPSLPVHINCRCTYLPVV